ncbi:MAG: putative LysR-family regulatory protein [Pseudomonas sp.]|nr:putative LysR-family regulatory protein [Pseudomonas sp.]
MGDMNDSGLIARKIAESPRVVMGTPAYFERYGEPTSPADLAGHQTVVYSQYGGGANWLFKQGSAEQSVTVTGRVRVTAAEGVRVAVLAHLGLTLSSEWMFRPELASGEVRRVLEGWDLPGVDLWAVFPTGRMASAKARAFVTYVEQLLAKDVAVDL